MLLRWKPPLAVVKAVCRLVMIPAIFFVVLGNWAVALCLILGAMLFEKNLYRCRHCMHKLDMRMALGKTALCPACHGSLC